MSADYLPVHDPAVHGNAYAVKEPGHVTGPFAAARPWSAVLAVPVHHGPSCGSCGETFAGDRAAFYVTPLLEGAEDAAIMSAGWREDDGTLTCTVCQAKANATAPEPEPATEHQPAPDTDPYRQYEAMTAELDTDVASFWGETNQSNNAARFRIRTRFRDAQIRIDEIQGRAA